MKKLKTEVCREVAEPLVQGLGGDVDEVMKKKVVKLTAVVLIPSQVLHGADMALRDNDGYTPLHLAAREGHVDAFKEMLRKGTENCKALVLVAPFWLS